MTERATWGAVSVKYTIAPHGRLTVAPLPEEVDPVCGTIYRRPKRHV